jgi:hypothetical protein
MPGRLGSTRRKLAGMNESCPAQISQIWAAKALINLGLSSRQIESRAMAPASDRYAARLVFQSAGVLIEYLLCVDSGFRIG